MAAMNNEPLYIVQYLNALGSRAVRYGADYVPSGPTRDRGMIKKTLEHRPVSKPSTTVDSEPTVSAVPAETYITLVVKTLKGGQSYTLSGVDLSTATVVKLKKKLAAQSKIPVSNQRLVLKGKALVDSKLLSEYGIIDGMTINLIVKAPEPGPAASTSSSSPELNATLKTTQFWHSLSSFLVQLFPTEEDADSVLERFLESYRDVVGDLSVADVKKLQSSS